MVLKFVSFFFLAWGSYCYASQTGPNPEACEENSHLSSEHTLAARSGELKSFWFAQTKRSFFEGVGATPIAYYPLLHTVPRGAGATAKDLVIVVPGNSETSYKYRELVFDLFGQGFDVLVYEHRGQGASGHTLDPALPQDVVHVDEFQEYVEDLKTLIHTVVPHIYADRTGPKKIFLLAHSMGAGIATEYLLTAGQNAHVDGAALLAPLFRINSSPLPLCVAEGMFEAECVLGQGQRAPLLQRVLQAPIKFYGNKSTSSLPRFVFKRAILSELEAEGFAHVRKSGSSSQWFRQMCLMSNEILRNARLLSVPTYIFQAEQDGFVDNSSHGEFCQETPLCKVETVGGALHEIYLERDEIRNPTLEKIFTFFRELSFTEAS